MYLPRFAELVLAPFLVVAALVLADIKRRAVRLAVNLGFAIVLLAGTVIGYAMPNKVGLANFAERWRQSGPPDLAVFWPEYNARTASYYLNETIVSAKRNEILQTLQLINHDLKIWLCIDENFKSSQTASDREFHTWMNNLGPIVHLGKIDNLTVKNIAARPQKPDFPLLQRGNRMSFGALASDVYLPSGWYGGETTFRWSQGAESTVVFALDRAQASELVVEMFCYGKQRLSVELNGNVLESFVCSQRAAHTRRFVMSTDIVRQQNVLVFRHQDAVSPKESGEGEDTRLLALGISWLEVK